MAGLIEVVDTKLLAINQRQNAHFNPQFTHPLEK
jgi:hypothetical protein